jgi:hypothetical protein
MGKPAQLVLELRRGAEIVQVDHVEDLGPVEHGALVGESVVQVVARRAGPGRFVAGRVGHVEVDRRGQEGGVSDPHPGVGPMRRPVGDLQSREIVRHRFGLIAGELRADLEQRDRPAQPRHVLDAVAVVALDHCGA